MATPDLALVPGPPAVEPDPLDVLAERVRAEIDACQRVLESAVEHPARSGLFLIEAKSLVPRGRLVSLAYASSAAPHRAATPTHGNILDPAA